MKQLNSNYYDKLLKEDIGDKHIQNESYYDYAYAEALVLSLLRDKVLFNYASELELNSRGVKMCSIGSSARYCYLASKSLYKIDELEKTDIFNDFCRPHYDGYNTKGNIFYEFKCHELCSNEHKKEFYFKYNYLFKKIYGIEIDNPVNLKLSHFGIEMPNDPTIFDINFDLKQFLCHIFGLLAVATVEKPATLNYVWITPNIRDDRQELKEFVHDIKEQINMFFDKFSNMTINYKEENRLIKDIIKFKLDIRSCTEIEDFILKSLK